MESRLSPLLLRRDALLARLHAIPNLMRGRVYLRERKCGRKSCVCAQGGPKHHGLQMTVKLDGRSQNRFVRQADLAQITGMTDAYRELWEIVEELTRVNLEMIRHDAPAKPSRKSA